MQAMMASGCKKEKGEFRVSRGPNQETFGDEVLLNLANLSLELQCMLKKELKNERFEWHI